jgi:hypothetical protein
MNVLWRWSRRRLVMKMIIPVMILIVLACANLAFTQAPAAYGPAQAQRIYGQPQPQPVYGPPQAQPMYGAQQPAPAYGNHRCMTSLITASSICTANQPLLRLSTRSAPDNRRNSSSSDNSGRTGLFSGARRRLNRLGAICGAICLLHCAALIRVTSARRKTDRRSLILSQELLRKDPLVKGSPPKAFSNTAGSGFREKPAPADLRRSVSMEKALMDFGGLLRKTGVNVSQAQAFHSLGIL